MGVDNVQLNKEGYGLKVWLFTLAIPPFLFLIAAGMQNAEVFNFELIVSFLQLYFLYFFFGFVFSMPAFLIFLFFLLMHPSDMSVLKLKFYLVVIGLITVFLTFLVVFRGTKMDTQTLLFACSYAVALIFWIFKIRIGVKAKDEMKAM